MRRSLVIFVVAILVLFVGSVSSLVVDSTVHQAYLVNSAGTPYSIGTGVGSVSASPLDSTIHQFVLIDPTNGLPYTASTIPSGAAGGSLGGTYPNPTVLKLNDPTPATATNGTLGAGSCGNQFSLDGAINVCAKKYSPTCDGSVDDTIAVASALTDAGTNPSSSVLDMRYCRALKTTSTLTVPANVTVLLGDMAWTVATNTAFKLNSNSAIKGAGGGRSVLTYSAGGPTTITLYMISNVNTSGTVGNSNIEVSGLTLDGDRTDNAAITSTAGVRVFFGTNIWVHDNIIQNFTGPAVRISNLVSNNQIYNNVTTNNYTGSSKQHILVDKTSTASASAGLYVFNNTIDATTTTPVGCISIDDTVAAGVFTDVWVMNNRCLVGDAGASSTLGIEAFQSTSAYFSRFHILSNSVICQEGAGGAHIYGISLGGSVGLEAEVRGNEVIGCNTFGIEDVWSNSTIANNRMTRTGNHTINATGQPSTTLAADWTAPAASFTVASATNIVPQGILYIAGAGNTGDDFFRVTGVSGTTITVERNNTNTVLSGGAVKGALTGVVWVGNVDTDNQDATNTLLINSNTRVIYGARISDNSFIRPTASCIRPNGNASGLITKSTIGPNTIVGRGAAQSGNAVSIPAANFNNNTVIADVHDWGGAGSVFSIAASSNNNTFAGTYDNNAATLWSNAGTGNVLLRDVTSALTGLIKGNGTSAPTAYTGTDCGAGNAIRSLDANGANSNCLTPPTVFASGTQAVTDSATVGCVDQDVTVTNATTAMTVLVSPQGAPAGVGGGNITWAGYASAGKITIRVCTIVAVTGAATTYNYKVLN